MTSKHFYNEGSSCTSIDSDSDIKEILYSSSSYDRSSVGSIPWAEDAIKQNQQEWERIERMFYGEEKLPLQEIELRNEILEWRRAFPHLRVNGKKLNTVEFNNLNSSRKEFEEVLVIHPIDKVFKIKSNEFSSQNNSFNKEPQITKDKILISELEKNLRINSVPIPHRQLTKNYTKNKNNLKPSINTYQNVAMQNLRPSQTSRSVYPGTRNSKSGTLAKKTSNSANFVRMPPIINTIIPSTNYHTHPPIKQNNNYLMIKSKPTEKSVTVLPEIESSYKNHSQNKNCRSISAAITRHKTSDHLFLNSASKLKISK